MQQRSGVIRIVASVIRDGDDRVLLVRKRGTTAFMQPGGKYEPGETARQTLVRELEEELGVVVDPDSLVHVGHFDAPAANEPGFWVDAEVFTVPPVGEVGVRAEIEELRWVRLSELDDVELAPLFRDLIVPMMLAGEIPALP
jgi:mutator protein MutT